MDSGDETWAGYFFRNGICCTLTCNPAGIWWAHIGLERTHPWHGRLFVALHPRAVHALAIPPTLTSEVLRAKWWMGFEGGYSRDRTLGELKAIADAAGSA